MPVQIIIEDDLFIARLSGEIDDFKAKEMRDEIDRAAMRIRPGELRLDFSEVPFMDSSGIGLIIGRYKLTRLWGGSLVLEGMSQRIEMLVRLSGADRLVRIERSEHENAG